MNDADPGAASPAASPVRRVVVATVLLLLIGVIAALVRFQHRNTRSHDAAAATAPRLPAEFTAAKRQAQLGDDEAALALVDQAVEKCPDCIDVRLLRAEVLFRLHRSDEMIPSLRKALELNPECFEAHANLAYALRYVGELEAAEREAEWCLARRPEHVAVRRVLAEIDRDRGDVDGALREVRRALRSEPENLQARLLEADLLMFNRDFDTAYARLAPLKAAHRRHPRYQSALVRAARLSDRPEQADRLEHEFAGLRPTDQ